MLPWLRIKTARPRDDSDRADPDRLCPLGIGNFASRCRQRCVDPLALRTMAKAYNRGQLEGDATENVMGSFITITGIVSFLWAIVLLVWQIVLLFDTPHVSSVWDEDHRLLIGGRLPGETITIPIWTSERDAVWKTTGISMSLTSPSLDPIEASIVASKEFGRPEKLVKNSTSDISVIYGEYTIRKTLPENVQWSGDYPYRRLDYIGTVHGVITHVSASAPGRLTTRDVPLNNDVKLVIYETSWWSEAQPERWKRWLGPSWRNAVVLGGVGLALMYIAIPGGSKREAWWEDEDSYSVSGQTETGRSPMAEEEEKQIGDAAKTKEKPGLGCCGWIIALVLTWLFLGIMVLIIEG